MIVENGRKATAKIYQFPVKTRLAPESRGEVARITAEPVSVSSGSGWYHEDALRDADHTRKH